MEKDLQPDLRQKANDFLSRFSPSERESLLIKCWMSHDACWFTAVAAEYGVPAASRLNQIATREIGKVEAPPGSGGRMYVRNHRRETRLTICWRS